MSLEFLGSENSNQNLSVHGLQGSIGLALFDVLFIFAFTLSVGYLSSLGRCFVLMELGKNALYSL